MYKCKFGCGKSYNQRTSLRKHYKTCDKQHINLKNNDQTKQLITVIENMENRMERKMEQMQQGFADVKFLVANSEPKTLININNIVLTEKLPSGGPKSFYDEIIKKFGEKHGNDKLAFLAGKSDAVGVYKMLYPSEKMSDNPVIYENNQFKFLSDDDEIKFGEEVIHRVTKHVKAAMLYASNAIIKTSLDLNKTERLYEYYNLGNIQGNALKEKMFQKQIAEYIKNKLICA